MATAQEEVPDLVRLSTTAMCFKLVNDVLNSNSTRDGPLHLTQFGSSPAMAMLVNPSFLWTIFLQQLVLIIFETT